MSSISFVAREDAKNDNCALGIDVKSNTEVARAKAEFRSERPVQSFDFAFARFCEANGYTYDAALIGWTETSKVLFSAFGPAHGRATHSAIPRRLSSSS